MHLVVTTMFRSNVFAEQSLEGDVQEGKASEGAAMLKKYTAG